MKMREIPITQIGVKIGQAEDAAGGTGCTVFICEEGMRAGLEVRGGGPASRESELLKPLAHGQIIHAIVLAGGSAFGLGAANGVMSYLEERGIGLDVGVTKVPLMGYEAAKNAMEAPNYQDGNHGAGCGATVGKCAGMDRCMKSGIGSYAVELGPLRIGAVVVVNAFGDIFDWKTGQKAAGLLTEDKTGFYSTPDLMKERIVPVANKFVGNTTLGVVMTNAGLNKTQLCKTAGMAHNGFCRSIRPVHTSVDGDSIYAVSVGNVAADPDLVGMLAAEVISEAILRAIYSAESAYGFVSAKDLKH